MTSRVGASPTSLVTQDTKLAANFQNEPQDSADPEFTSWKLSRGDSEKILSRMERTQGEGSRYDMTPVAKEHKLQEKRQHFHHHQGQHHLKRSLHNSLQEPPRASPQEPQIPREISLQEPTKPFQEPSTTQVRESQSRQESPSEMHESLKHEEQPKPSLHKAPPKSPLEEPPRSFQSPPMLSLQEPLSSSSIACKPSTTAPTQNFTLNIEAGRTLLYYGQELVIDLTIHERIALGVADTVLYHHQHQHNTVVHVAVHVGTKEPRYFRDIQRLVLYDGSKMNTLFQGNNSRNEEGEGGEEEEEEEVVLKAISAKLYANADAIFYSCSEYFNVLLDKELAGIARNARGLPVSRRVRFESLFGGKMTVLAIDRTPIIVLTGAEARTVSPANHLLYRDNTLCIVKDTGRHHGASSGGVGEEEEEEVEGELSVSMLVEVFPTICHLYLVESPSLGRKGVSKHTSSFAASIAGSGALYVHKQTQTAFYSTDDALNHEIADHLAEETTPFDHTSFSIRFEVSNNNNNNNNNNNGGGRQQLEVVVTANGNEVIRLKPHKVIDKSVATQHHMTYTNQTVYIMDGAKILDVIRSIAEIRVHTEDGLHLFVGSSWPAGVEQVLGGGQFFGCEGLGLYSTDSNLNDRIGNALLGAEKHTIAP